MCVVVMLSCICFAVCAACITIMVLSLVSGSESLCANEGSCFAYDEPTCEARNGTFCADECSVGACVVTPTTFSTLTPSPTGTGGCCAEDPYTFVGSPWASSTPNACGSLDYDCDGVQSSYACCADVSPYEDGSRVLWNVTEGCHEFEETAIGECGVCDHGNRTNGWVCHETTQKRYSHPCPDECSSTVAAELGNYPDISECGLFVTGCGAFDSEYEACCTHVVL